MITTRTQFINCLVEQGRHPGLAKAMVTEFFDHSDGANDLIYAGDAKCVVTYTPEVALSEFDKICADYDAFVEPEEDGIMFDGELAFDLEGNYLSKQ